MMISPNFDESTFSEMREEVERCVRAFPLALQSPRWRGAAGSFLGSAEGSSLDFHDQRPYAPGDDPRHINWQAYGRSNALTMKLYREEVQPVVDLLFDASASMAISVAKAQRSTELFLYCAQSALQQGASLRIWMHGAEGWQDLTQSGWREYAWWCKGLWTPAASSIPPWSRCPLRPRSLRLWISDCLFPLESRGFWPGLLQKDGRALILCPFAAEEERLEGRGNFDIVDVETSQRHRCALHPDLLERYELAYQNHFRLWRESAQRHGVGWWRFSSQAELSKVLAPCVHSISTVR